MRIGRLAIALLIVTVAAASASAEAGPRISFEKETHDYGRVLYGDTVVEEFVFSNTGDKTLIIEDLRSSCGCTKAVEGSREIPPQGTSKIVASFDTTGLRAGGKKKHIYVHSNDPSQPVVKLTLLADVVREISVEPPTLASQTSTPDQAVTFAMKVSNSSQKVWHVKGIKTVADGVQISLNPERFTLPPGAAVPVNLVVRPEKQKGRSYYMGKVFLETDHPRENEVEVRYLIKLDKAQ